RSTISVSFSLIDVIIASNAGGWKLDGGEENLAEAGWEGVRLFSSPTNSVASAWWLLHHPLSKFGYYIWFNLCNQHLVMFWANVCELIVHTWQSSAHVSD